LHVVRGIFICERCELARRSEQMKMPGCTGGAAKALGKVNAWGQSKIVPAGSQMPCT
jgi:hypothetical protein